MKTQLNGTLPKPDRESSSRLARWTLGLLGTLTAAAALPMASLTVNAEEAKAAAAPPPESRVHALVNFEFSDKYLTPRGMIVVRNGFTFQPLVLGLVNVYKGDGFINDITLVPGVWNDFTSSGVPASGTPGHVTSWVEIDPIAGISFGFAKNWKLDFTYTAFNMQVFNIAMSQHLETKLSYDDSGLLKAFALHPYVIYWQELQGKATAAANFGVKSSFYFDIGISPSYTVGKVKLEAPMRVLLPDANFYGETFAKSSTVGLFELGVKGTVPMDFMPQGYGHWSFHAGYRYMNFVDKNLQQLAQSGGFGSPTKDSSQIYAGFSAFF